MPLDFVSFNDGPFPMVPGPVSLDVARTNLRNLGTKMSTSGASTIIIGPPGDFYIAQGSQGAAPQSIVLTKACNVICLPGCRIIRQAGFDSAQGGVLEVPANVAGFRWIGGTFVGTPKAVVVDGISYDKYPPGQVIRLEGDDAVLEDVTIDGYSGIAVMVAGDRVRVVNLTIRNPQDEIPDPDSSKPPQVVANGAGIRVKRGTGFLGIGGDITSGGDAAIQFSGDNEFASDLRGNLIADGLFRGVACTSKGGGRLMLVGTTSPPIRDVRFVGITGTCGGKGDCIRIQNRNPGTAPIPKKTISNVVFRDIVVTNGDPSSYAVAIENELTETALSGSRTGDDIAISGIVFANLSITTTSPSDIGFATFAVGATALRPIRDVTWRAGGIASAANSTVAAISLSQLDGGMFAGLTIDAGGAPAAVACGDQVTPGSPSQCTGVVVLDSTVRGFRVNGVRLTAAADCGMVGGALAQATGPNATGLRMAATASRCFADGIDVRAVPASPPVIAGGAVPRVRDLFRDPAAGKLPAIVPPVGAGPAQAVTTSGGTIAGRAGQVSVTPAGGASLTAVTGGTPGDLLIVCKATGTAALTVQDGTGLALHGDCPLDKADDVLALVGVAAGSWAELSRSDNT